jgi:hypothetical protein
MLRLLLLPLFRKSGSKTVNAVNNKQTLAKFLVILKMKSPRLLSQDTFLYWESASVQDLNGTEGVKRICHCPHLLDFSQADSLICWRVN